jgi:hypothetical protein
MVAPKSQALEIVPNGQQAGRLVFQLMQAVHHGKHSVTRSGEGIHVQLETPVNLAELGEIPNRMADANCAKITVQDITTTRGQIVAYDSKDTVMFRFGNPEAMVAPIFERLVPRVAS